MRKSSESRAGIVMLARQPGQGPDSGPRTGRLSLKSLLLHPEDAMKARAAWPLGEESRQSERIRDAGRRSAMRSQEQSQAGPPRREHALTRPDDAWQPVWGGQSVRPNKQP